MKELGPITPGEAVPSPSYQIKQMPDRQLLEDFLMGMSGRPGVVFDLEKGIFERTMPRNELLKRRLDSGGS